jgi:hypothetical protein
MGASFFDAYLKPNKYDPGQIRIVDIMSSDIAIDEAATRGSDDAILVAGRYFPTRNILISTFVSIDAAINSFG